MTKYVKALLRYPILGCAPERLITAVIDERGIDLDGRWAVICADGRVVSRKEGHAGTLRLQSIRDIAVTTKTNGIIVKAPGMQQLFIPYPAFPDATRDPLMPQWRGKGIEVSRECSLWFTEYLSKERLDCYQLVELSHEEKLSFGGNARLHMVSEHTLRTHASRGCDVFEDECPNIVLGGCGESEIERIDLALLGGILLHGQGACGPGKSFSLKGRGNFVHEGARVEVLS